MNIDIPTYVVPLLICCARIVDVSLGTLRTVMVVKGKLLLAAVLGFFEVLIWVMAAGKILTSFR